MDQIYAESFTKHDEIISSLKIPPHFKNKLKYDLNYLLRYHIPDLQLLVLYGRCARGNLRRISEIELLVVTDRSIPNRFLKGMIKSVLYDKVDGVSTNACFCSFDSYLNSEDAFSKQLRKDGIILWKKDK